MKTIETLNYEFWKYFKEISSIPRKSGHEEKIVKYLVDFAQKRNLKFYSDKYNNVIIWKEASEGYEYKETLGLQCHTDMVCEKSTDSEHDFYTDPLELIVEGDYIKANQTTLGADNGIGIAYILAILDSTKISTPKLECIFTAEEETTMNGIAFLDASIMEAKRIISFDNFNENEMCISSATAKEWYATIEGKKIELISDNYSTFSLKLENFKGGHSGLDIGDESRGNPIKICVNLLKPFSDLYIANCDGGTKVNTIPRECEIQFTISNNELFKLTDLKKTIKKIEKEYPNANISICKVDTIKKCFSGRVSKSLLNFIETFQNGVIKKDQYGNVVLSANLATVRSKEKDIELLYSIRYNSDKLGTNLEEKIKNNMKRYEIISKECIDILGYEQDENSKLVRICEKIYLKYFNENIKKTKVQACLECGYLNSKISDLQYVAIAPNIYDAHSPTEKMSIKSANKIWGFIVSLIENIN